MDCLTRIGIFRDGEHVHVPKSGHEQREEPNFDRSVLLRFCELGLVSQFHVERTDLGYHVQEHHRHFSDESSSKAGMQRDSGVHRNHAAGHRPRSDFRLRCHFLLLGRIWCFRRHRHSQQLPPHILLMSTIDFAVDPEANTDVYIERIDCSDLPGRSSQFPVFPAVQS